MLYLRLNIGIGSASAIEKWLGRIPHAALDWSRAHWNGDGDMTTIATFERRLGGVCVILRLGIQLTMVRNRSSAGVAKMVNAEIPQISGRKPLWVCLR